MKVGFLGIHFLLLMLLGPSCDAQDPQETISKEVKTMELTVDEYQKWLLESKDWPNLARYREANDQLGPPSTGEKRVVFMGNSITEGWTHHSPEFFEGKPYINRGIGGQTTPQMLLRFTADVIDLKPLAVVVLGGTNDLAGNTGPSTLKMIRDNLASMAQLAQANGISVILSSVLPVYDYVWSPGLEPAERIVALNTWIKNYAAKNGMVYLDYFTSMADQRNGMREAFSEDGVHPNKQGYLVMERLVEVAITEAIGD